MNQHFAAFDKVIIPSLQLFVYFLCILEIYALFTMSLLWIDWSIWRYFKDEMNILSQPRLY